MEKMIDQRTMFEKLIDQRRTFQFTSQSPGFGADGGWAGDVRSGKDIPEAMRLNHVEDEVFATFSRCYGLDLLYRASRLKTREGDEML